MQKGNWVANSYLFEINKIESYAKQNVQVLAHTASPCLPLPAAVPAVWAQAGSAPPVAAGVKRAAGVKPRRTALPVCVRKPCRPAPLLPLQIPGGMRLGRPMNGSEPIDELIELILELTELVLELTELILEFTRPRTHSPSNSSSNSLIPRSPGGPRRPARRPPASAGR